MMNKKKILILLILFVAVAGLTLTPVASKTYTKTIKFKSSGTVNKYIGKGDYIGVSYTPGYSGMSGKTNTFEIRSWSSDYFSNYYKLTKAKVTFTKKVKGKSKKYAKTYTANKYGGVVSKHPPSGYKPYSVKVTYKTI
ncbi:MAG: hypothetical protein FWH54_00110 [Methanobrevibacter sp.]|nr:hypothetical protein [Methanobrevibacter sp.]